MKTIDQDYLKNGQYGNSANLSSRVNLHEKFSTNKIGWPKWVFDKIALFNKHRILELGAGYGILWTENKDRLPDDWSIVISDLSEGMLSEAKDNLSGLKNITDFKTIDIQKIPFPDNSFDCIIANHMLYHVPDKSKALSEIRRVLTQGGCLFAATNGSTHMRELHNLIRKFIKGFESSTSQRFNLENGQEQLELYFDSIELLKYQDSLVVDEPLPLIDYFRSVVGLENVAHVHLEQIEESIHSSFNADGKFHISKDGGLFITR